jgi:cytochrome c oxidase cbb3-type subunit 1
MVAPSSTPAAPEKIPALPARPYSPLEIDVSCSTPLMLLFFSAAVWLAIGTFLNCFAFIKLHVPGFFANVPWLSFGRIRPAGMDALLYGFASQAAIGLIVWLTCRLSAVTLCCKNMVTVAAAFWNLGVTVGVLAVLGGDSTGFAWLEMPRFSNVILFVSFVVIGLSVLSSFHNRAEPSVYVSQWYVLAGLFWFPWILSAASLLLLRWPVRGVLQTFVNAWFTNNFLTLWLGCVALATLFYFLPKLLQRPLYSRSVAAFGFWTYLIAAGWTGSIQLIGGPLPSWMTAIGSSATIVLIIPTVAVALNWYMTGTTGSGVKGQNAEKFCPISRGCRQLRFSGDGVASFLVFGGLCYFIASIGGILMGCPSFARITQFSLVPLALVYLIIFGFFGMTAFGAIYYIVPRATRLAWPSEKLVRTHYLCSAVGIAILFLALLIGGLVQGYRLNQTVADIVPVSRVAIPFIGLATLAFLLLFVGQIAFLKNFVTLLHRQGAPVRKAAAELFVPMGAGAGGKS